MNTDRRSFLVASALAAAGITVESSRGFAANDILQVGLIGCGGRCRHLLKSFPALPNVKITAVCDVWNDNLDAAKKLADPRAFATKKHEELLARRDVDAVVIASPDHWHVPHTVDACQAGKDVYVEKPISHNVFEGRQMVRAARKYNRIVQVGSQGRSIRHKQRAMQLLAEGAIGKPRNVL